MAHPKLLRVRWISAVCGTIVLAVSCARPYVPPAPFSAIAAAEIRAADSTKNLSPCFVPNHGRGRPPVAPAKPIYRQGRRPDAELERNGLGELWIRTYSVESGQALNAAFNVQPNGRAKGIARVDSNWVRMREPARTYLLQLLSWPNRWEDSVTFRSGFVDTLVLGLGRRWMCSI